MKKIFSYTLILLVFATNFAFSYSKTEIYSAAQNELAENLKEIEKQYPIIKNPKINEPIIDNERLFQEEYKETKISRVKSIGKEIGLATCGIVLSPIMLPIALGAMIYAFSVDYTDHD